VSAALASRKRLAATQGLSYFMDKIKIARAVRL
jgi:hypothetical protein